VRNKLLIDELEYVVDVQPALKSNRRSPSAIRSSKMSQTSISLSEGNQLADKNEDPEEGAGKKANEQQQTLKRSTIHPVSLGMKSQSSNAPPIPVYFRLNYATIIDRDDST
jgi:hypothetical protein